jgi:hypothetical protein
MYRPQFSLKTLLWLTAVVAAFAGGIRFERERRRKQDEAALEAAIQADYFISGPQSYIDNPQLGPTPLPASQAPR